MATFDIWEGYYEPRSVSLPYINNDILLICVWSVYLSLVGYVAPKLAKKFSPADLRPLMLILDGFSFGATGAGVMVFGYLLNFGIETFQKCELNYHPMIDEANLLIAYAFFLFRHFEMLIPLVMIARKKFDQEPFKVALQNCVSTFILAFAVRHYTRDLAVLYPILDGLKLFLRSGYFALKAPGNAFPWIKRIKKPIIIANLILHFIVLLQFFIITLRGCKYPRAILLVAELYTIVEAVFATKKLLREDNVKKER